MIDPNRSFAERLPSRCARRTLEVFWLHFLYPFGFGRLLKEFCYEKAVPSAGSAQDKALWGIVLVIGLCPSELHAPNWLFFVADHFAAKQDLRWFGLSQIGSKIEAVPFGVQIMSEVPRPNFTACKFAWCFLMGAMILAHRFVWRRMQ